MDFYKLTHEAYLAAKAAGSNIKEDDVFIEGYSSGSGDEFIDLVKVQSIPSLDKDFFVCEKQLVNNYFERINNAWHLFYYDFI